MRRGLFCCCALDRKRPSGSYGDNQPKKISPSHAALKNNACLLKLDHSTFELLESGVIHTWAAAMTACSPSAAETYHLAQDKLGPVRFEWVHDGSRVWIVQLHKGATDSSASTLVPGEADQWEVFDVASGLEELRRLLAQLPSNVGLQIRGDVGLTSHVADLLRKAQRPARLQTSN
jgi:hypothetical protein